MEQQTNLDLNNTIIEIGMKAQQIKFSIIIKITIKNVLIERVRFILTNTPKEHGGSPRLLKGRD